MGIYTAKPYIDDKICNDVVSVLKSGMIVQGPKVKELEEKFSKKCNVKYCIRDSSGTAALHSALFSVGIQAGDEVITTPFTFVATANSILMVGAKPVFAAVSYTHLRAHETRHDLVCRLLLEKKKKKK